MDVKNDRNGFYPRLLWHVLKNREKFIDEATWKNIEPKLNEVARNALRIVEEHRKRDAGP